MNRLAYDLASQRSYIGQMATIMTIIIGVISLLVKWNILTREVFWWLVAGREHLMFFFAKKLRDAHWEVVRRLPSPTRINLEEPVRVASPHRIMSFLCLSVCQSISKG
jgi:hypothetical protein